MSLSISAEKFRCFDKLNEVELRPLTILVGENSAGKSSFLALIRYACESIAFNGNASFNKEPFLLGSYEQIAFSPGGRSGRADSFRFNLKRTIEKRSTRSRMPYDIKYPASAEFDIEFHNVASQPRMKFATIRSDEIQFQLDATTGAGVITSGNYRIETDIRQLETPDGKLELASVPHLFMSAIFTQESRIEDDFKNEVFSAYQTLQTSTYDHPLSVYASAPVRTAPRRTYNPLDESPNPDGSHVLNALARLKRTQRDKWKAVKQDFDRFGSQSGLFRSFDIRLLGDRESDPFQAQIKTGGFPSNLIDVGYGISQILPIVYDISQENYDIVLLQQPEVHLHPRAQTGLGSFLLSASQSKTIVVETHSDYIIDQVRIDIRKSQGNIDPDDVAIYFFERVGSGVAISRLKLDSEGNIIDIPKGYRDFFIQHENTLLGIDNVSNSRR